MQTNATFQTARGAALVATMTKHFGHKIPVTAEAERAELYFDGGLAVLVETPGGLALSVDAADAATHAQLQDVVERHLLRFAYHDEPAPLVWSQG